MTNALTLTAEPGQPFVDTVREFDAPVDALFLAHRDPELVAKWLGPEGQELEIESYDYRTGGAYRYANIDGNDRYTFSGVFHKVRDNELVIQTFEFEGFPDVVSLETIRFEDLGGGRSQIVSRVVFPSQDARDGIVESGMEQGLTEGYAKLDQVLDR